MEQSLAVASPLWACGVDLSARRGLHLAVLDSAGALVSLSHHASPADLISSLQRRGGHQIVAIDAPQAPSHFPLREESVRATLPCPPTPGTFLRHRVCDYELVRRGIGLYLLPEPGNAPPSWMQVGFDTFDLCQSQLGQRLPASTTDWRATLLEAYPYAAFVTLLCGRPEPKTTATGREQRLHALRRAGVSQLPGVDPGHDLLDALAAALTALCWHRGQGHAVGLVEEGLIALPVPPQELRQAYRKLPSSSIHG